MVHLPSPATKYRFRITRSSNVLPIREFDLKTFVSSLENLSALKSVAEVRFDYGGRKGKRNRRQLG